MRYTVDRLYTFQNEDDAQYIYETLPKRLLKDGHEVVEAFSDTPPFFRLCLRRTWDQSLQGLNSAGRTIVNAGLG
jgi:hypothetical protein